MEHDHIPDIDSPQEQTQAAHLPPGSASKSEATRPSFRDVILAQCAESIGTVSDGDLIPSMIFEAATASGFRLAEDPSDYGRLRSWARGVYTVDIPSPGDIAILRLGGTDRYWGGVVRSVAGREMSLYLTQPFRDAADNMLVLVDVSGTQVNRLWTISTFIRF